MLDEIRKYLPVKVTLDPNRTLICLNMHVKKCQMMKIISKIVEIVNGLSFKIDEGVM